jgi:hypothetical protein
VNFRLTFPWFFLDILAIRDCRVHGFDFKPNTHGTCHEVIAMQVRQDTQLAMTFPFVVFCHYSEQFYVSQAEQFSDCLSGQKQIYEIVKVIHCATLITSSYNSHAHEIAVCFFIWSGVHESVFERTVKDKPKTSLFASSRGYKARGGFFDDGEREKNDSGHAGGGQAVQGNISGAGHRGLCAEGLCASAEKA